MAINSITANEISVNSLSSMSSMSSVSMTIAPPIADFTLVRSAGYNTNDNRWDFTDTLFTQTEMTIPSAREAERTCLSRLDTWRPALYPLRQSGSRQWTRSSAG
jgi:hypothetical protein